MRVGFIGNTALTYKGLRLAASYGYTIPYVYGLSPENLNRKVGKYDLRSYCDHNDIVYYDDEDWRSIESWSVDYVIELGDSRIIPKKILEDITVIGNHGAILPRVQGAASLVWGRMLNNGEWGASLMELNEVVDNGDIIATEPVTYSSDISMQGFVDLCDDATIKCLQRYFDGDYEKKSNEKWHLKVRKGVDSEKAVKILENSLYNDINVYMPPRTEEDGILKGQWSDGFKVNFKKSLAKPYPPWTKAP